MKLFLASFFLCVFSFQVLPVKEIGKLLFKQTMTEEIHESECDGGDECGTGNDVKKENDPYSPVRFMLPERSFERIYAGKCTLAGPDHVSKQYIPDILTPPPNCL